MPSKRKDRLQSNASVGTNFDSAYNPLEEFSLVSLFFQQPEPFFFLSHVIRLPTSTPHTPPSRSKKPEPACASSSCTTTTTTTSVSRQPKRRKKRVTERWTAPNDACEPPVVAVGSSFMGPPTNPRYSESLELPRLLRLFC